MLFRSVAARVGRGGPAPLSSTFDIKPLTVRIFISNVDMFDILYVNSTTSLPRDLGASSPLVYHPKQSARYKQMFTVMYALYFHSASCSHLHCAFRGSVMPCMCKHLLYGPYIAPTYIRTLIWPPGAPGALLYKAPYIGAFYTGLPTGTPSVWHGGQKQAPSVPRIQKKTP